MRISPKELFRLIYFLTVLLPAIFVFQTSGLVADGIRQERERTQVVRNTTGNEDEAADELKSFLTAAIQARGGLAKLKNLKDSYSLSRIVYGDAYSSEILYRTWTMEPDCFRQDIVRDGRILKCQQYDGKHFVESYGQRVRFGLEKDLRTLLENVELNKVFSLLPIGSEEFPARLCGKARLGGRWLREVHVEAPSGLTYRLYFDEETHLITKLEYVERTEYSQSREIYPTIAYVDSYRPIDGILVAEELRIFSEGVLKAVVHLVEHEFNVGLKSEFFSLDRLRQDLPTSPIAGRKTTEDGLLQNQWKEVALNKIAGLLQSNGHCRFRQVASYGDLEVYRKRLFEPELTLVVDPKYLQNEDALGFYAELVPAPSGFYDDCIVLRNPPHSISVSPELLLHETTHALLRRRQEEAPLRTSDDENLTYYQAGLFHCGRLLQSFEETAFNREHAAQPATAEKAAGLWRAARQCLRENLGRSGLTPEALEQFKEWCGVDFDLNEIRKHYLGLGADPEWMPMHSTTRPKNRGSNPIGRTR